MSVTAGSIVNSVRDLVPDPVYASGVPNPDADGGITRASSLYRWLDAGVRVVAQKTQWTVTDWTAVQLVQSQPFYSLDSKWHRAEYGFVNLWPVEFIPETATIYPTRASSSQPLWATWHRHTDHLEVGCYPVINASDPVTTLTVNMDAVTTSPISVSSTIGFLTRGWIQIDSELMVYQTVASSTSVSVITRAQAGTTAAAHTAGADVSHLGFWIYGRRVPTAIVNSTSVVELPSGWTNLLETYLLAHVRRSENEHGEARALMKEFTEGCAAIAADPGWKVSQGTQIRAYGEPSLGPLWQGNIVVP